jgi:hypothetical protein
MPRKGHSEEQIIAALRQAMRLPCRRCRSEKPPCSLSPNRRTLPIRFDGCYPGIGEERATISYISINIRVR